MLPCARVTITAHHPVPAQIDGDAFGSTPLQIEAGPAHLQLILPDPSLRAAAEAR
jgi:diacylglycerol kinase family enzyme